MASLSFSCYNCVAKEAPPNIRVQPGIDYCDAMCQKFTELQCTGYYEPLEMPLSDGGIETMSCVSFCEYQMNQSVQLNPKCLAENLKTCDEIETICQ